MKIMSEMAKGLLSGDGATSDVAMDNIMNQFNEFLKESEGNEEMKSALDSVVNDVISKDTLYEPMKKLRDNYPAWLDAHSSEISDIEHQKYND